MSRMLTVNEVASELRVSRSSLYSMIRAGIFPSPIHPVPGRSVWPREVVDRWIEERSKQAASA